MTYRTFSKRLALNLALALAIFLLSLLLCELVMRWLVQPSEESYGTLFGIELPPYRLLPPTTPPPQIDRDTPYDALVMDGQSITVGDLWGIFREDPVSGYAPRENTSSANGWWQTNNIGARARYDTMEEEPIGQRRMLVFGDSFAAGSRVRQEEAWPAVLDARLRDWEVVSLGVDGYGVGQSYLRYQALAPRLDYDLVLFLFAPREDLWRDVNTRRDLAGNWELYWVMPRFVIEEGKLRLVEGTVVTEPTGLNGGTLDDRLRSHLRQYDRFYFRSGYEEPGFAGKSILYRLFAKAYHAYQQRQLHNDIRKPASEAVRVCRELFEAMRNEERQHDRHFVLVFLPSHRDLQLFERSASYSADWKDLVQAICGSDIACIDLSGDLRQVPQSQLDKGYDGTHYGPQSNVLIADLIRKYLDLGSVSGESYE